MPILFAVTLFISALLLFMVQPMVGRMILPLLGGSPATWNTCMVFFQFMLLLGYLYAHKLSARFGTRQQILIHLGVLGLAIGSFAAATLLSEKGSPIAVVKSLAPQNSAFPMFGVLALLFVAVGVPFFAVSATAPLLQRWFSKTGHAAAADPYFLYAASNAGSLLSLFLYPFVAEPNLTLTWQAWTFACGFGGLIVLILACGSFVPSLPADAVQANSADAPPPKRIFKWIVLAFVPSSLMLGVTFFMTTDIASIPLLWIIPLALYLLTFIIAFARTPNWLRVVVANAAPVITLLLLFVIITRQSLHGPVILISLHLLAFFLLALMCHSELARDRPPPQYLTNFFLWISFGGMLGGAFNALLAPVAFPLAYEYSISLCLGCLLVPKLTSEETITPEQTKRRRMLDILIPLGMLVLVANMTAHLTDKDWIAVLCEWLSDKISWLLQSCNFGVAITPFQIHDGLFWAVPLILCFLFIDRPLRFGLCVAAVVFVGEYRRTAEEQFTERSFFGILKIHEFKIREGPRRNESATRSLVHGTTLHGVQGISPWPYRSKRYGPEIVDPLQAAALIGATPVFGYDWSQEPLTYYHRSGPVGHMFAVTRERHPHPNVAMVGLGTGSVSCYASPNLDLTYYEIDPTVKKLVYDRPDFFTYVTDAKNRGAKLDCILGDARLKLEENIDARYDLLLIDAFSSDSIPVHLLTKEALELYLNRLTPTGLLGLHISNKYVKLDAVVARLAESLGLAALVFDDHLNEDSLSAETAPHQYGPPGKSGSQWVVLARDPARLEIFKEARFRTQYPYQQEIVNTETGLPKVPPICQWEPMNGDPKVKAWTDDYADVLLVMRLPQVQKIRRMFGLPTLDDLTK